MFNPFQMTSIRTKIAFWSGACLFLAATAIIAYAAVSIRSEAIERAKEHAAGIGISKAAAIEKEMEVGLGAARTLAWALSAVKCEDLPIDLKRDQVNGMLRHLLEETPAFLTAFTIWEPDAFDGKDSEFAGQEPYGAKGRFVAYWGRDEEGEPQLNPSLDHEEQLVSEEYRIPKTRGKECVIDPHLHAASGVETAHVSLVAPIVAGAQFCGVVGVDLSLEFLQQLAQDVDLQAKRGTMAVISNQGLLACVAGREDLLGQHMKAMHEDWKEDLTYIEGGEQIVEEDHGNIAVFVPMRPGRTESPWSVNLNIPLGEVTSMAAREMWHMVGIGGALSAAALAVLWFLSRQIAGPMVAVTAAAEAIAGGDLETRVNVTSVDETGVLAQAFNAMVVSLRRALADAQEKVAYLNNVPTPVVALDREQNVKFINEAGMRLLGTTAEAAVGQKCYNLFRTPQCQTGECCVSKAIDEDRACTDQTTAAALGGMPIQYTGAPLKDDQGNIVGALEFVVDITDLKQAEEGLQQANEFLEGKIGGATGDITSASAQILSATREQAASVSQQATAVNEASTTVTEARETADQSADRARLVSESSQECLEAANRGLEAVEEAVAGMNSIKDQVAAIAETILDLSEQTQQIGEIISTVNDIADQSNLLALNASIEAARAGEAGKGFAVVADEVRSLADQSREATAQVRDILGEIQKAANKAVMVTEEGTKRADAGVELSQTTGQAIQNINEQIQRIVQAAQQIAASAQQQLAGMDQISSAMGGISQGTQQTQAGAEQVEKAAESLNALAEQLNDVVKQYKAA